MRTYLTQARPSDRTQARRISAVGTQVADLKSAIDRTLTLPELLHFLAVLCLHKALTAEAAEEGDDEDEYGLDFEEEESGLETALLGYPTNLSERVQNCLDILIRRDDPTLNSKVMNRLWSRIAQFDR